MLKSPRFVALIMWVIVTPLYADPPVASYIFPAGGQRGTTVSVRVGGLNLHGRPGFEMLGAGVAAPKQLQETKTVWFEGPLLPLPDSQQAEDYPKDHAGTVQIAADTPLGARHWCAWTAQGATPAMRFMVGDLPELVEEEIDGDPIPVAVKLPVTINGRTFPREDVDVWAIDLQKGQSVVCEVHAARLGTPLDARLEGLDPQGRRLAESDDIHGNDPVLRFTAPVDGRYQIRIHDIAYRGGQAHVYRLTLTSGPYVQSVYPLGGRRGTKTRFSLTGQALPNEPIDIDIPADAPREFKHRLTVGDAQSNEFLLDGDDWPEHFETERGDAAARGGVTPPLQPIGFTAPSVLNGRIDQPGDIDAWTFEAKKGEVWEIELRAGRLGSPLLGVVTITDGSGKELARAENQGNDPALSFTIPADGTYQVRIADRFRSRGGPAFAYRLRIAKPSGPDYQLRLAADALAVNRGGEVKLKINVERRGGFVGPIELKVEGLPKGVSAANATIAANQTSLDITLKAEADAPIQAARLTVRGNAKLGDQQVTRTATLPTPRGEPQVDSVLLAVAVPTPFKVVGEYDMRWAPRGTVHRRKYRIERNGFDGPLTVRLADRQARHVQGVTGPTVTVPAGMSEFEYGISLPPWMEMGRTCRVCVMAIGTIKDADGAEQVISFTSLQQNEQLVAVIEPGRLGVEIERESLTAEPGKAVVIPVRVSRGKGLRGPVKVELIVAGHIRGVTADPVEIAADRNEGTVSIRFAAAVGPFNAPALLRATLVENGRPVVAEAKVTLLAP